MPKFEHDHPWDPTYGFDFESLLKLEAPQAPEGFDVFWEDYYQRALKVIPKPSLTNERIENGRKVFDLVFTSLDGVTIGGWVTIPEKGTIRRGIVCGHGYGGRGEPTLDHEDDVAVVFPCCRGLPTRSRSEDVMPLSANHVLHGIDLKETYIHGGCVTDLWVAVSVLQELYPETAEATFYDGGSFGGGIGALALPWDTRIKRAHLYVPSFGNHPYRLTVPCRGSGEAVRLYSQEKPHIISEVLPFFDSAIAATRVKIPVMVTCALFDPAVPPPGQFTVYNSLAGEKELFVVTAGHFRHPDEPDELAERDLRIKQFFAC